MKVTQIQVSEANGVKVSTVLVEGDCLRPGRHYHTVVLTGKHTEERYAETKKAALANHKHMFVRAQIVQLTPPAAVAV